MLKEKLDQAIKLSRGGYKVEAREILSTILEEDPQVEAAWLWLADTFSDTENRIRVLEDCLRHNPSSQIVQKWLTTFKAKEEARKAGAAEVVLPEFEDSSDEPDVSASGIHFDQQIDCRGLLCPMPILKTKKAMDPLKGGQVLKMIADDPNSPADVEAWTSKTGHVLIDHEIDDGIFTYYIKCRG